MRHDPVAEEGAPAPVRPIDELIRQHHVERRQLVLHAADGAHRDEVGHAKLLDEIEDALHRQPLSRFLLPPDVRRPTRQVLPGAWFRSG